MGRTKLQVRTSAERAALAAQLDELRGLAALIASDLDPALGGHDVGDAGDTLRRVRRIVAGITTILDGAHSPEPAL